MKINLIAALTENRVIGKNNKLPWHISADLKRFKELTTGHPVIMGRKTYESIGKPLPNRTNIVITRDRTYQQEGVIIAHTLDEAIKTASHYQTTNEVFVIGGGEIFREAIDSADNLYLTIVHTSVDGDAFFPDYSQFKSILYKEDGEEGDYKYTFINLAR